MASYQGEAVPLTHFPGRPLLSHHPARNLQGCWPLGLNTNQLLSMAGGTWGSSWIGLTDKEVTEPTLNESHDPIPPTKY